MKVFFVIFCLLLVLLNKKEIELNKKIKINLAFIVIGVLLILFSTLRTYLLPENLIGRDYYSYRMWYNDYNSLKDITTFSSFGFNLLIILTKRIFNNYTFFIFVISSIIIVNFLNFINKNSSNPAYSLFIFVAFGLFELSFNGMRQFLACSIWLLGYQYLNNKSLFKYIIICMIATTIHSSAILLLILYPIINCNMSFKLKTLSSAAVGLILSLPNITNRILNLSSLVDKNYLDRYGQSSAMMSDSNLTVFFISVLIFVLIVLAKNKNESITLKTNLEYLMILCVLAFLAPVHIIYSRIYLYFMPAIMLVVPDVFLVYNGENWKPLRLVVTLLFMTMFFI